MHFSPEQEAQLAQMAASAGTNAEHLVKDTALRLLAGNADTPQEAPHHTPANLSPVRRHISEVIQEIMSDVPREEFETLPRDGASEHDHYLYGAPKKNQ